MPNNITVSSVQINHPSLFSCTCSPVTTVVFIRVRFTRNGRHLPPASVITPSGPLITINYYSVMKPSIQDIAVGLGGDKGAGGEVFHSWRQMSVLHPPPTQCKHRRTQIRQLWQQTKTVCIQYDQFKVKYRQKYILKNLNVKDFQLNI